MNIMGAKKTVEEMIDGLAVTVQHGFDAMDKKFEVVDERFDALETKLERKIDDKIEGLAIAVQQGFEGVTEEFKNVRSEFNEGQGSLRKEINDGFRNVENELTTIKFQSSNLDPRVSVLEKKVSIIGIKLGLQS